MDDSQSLSVFHILDPSSVLSSFCVTAGSESEWGDSGGAFSCPCRTHCSHRYRPAPLLEEVDSFCGCSIELVLDAFLSCRMKKAPVTPSRHIWGFSLDLNLNEINFKPFTVTDRQPRIYTTKVITLMLIFKLFLLKVFCLFHCL